MLPHSQYSLSTVHILVVEEPLLPLLIFTIISAGLCGLLAFFARYVCVVRVIYIYIYIYIYLSVVCVLLTLSHTLILSLSHTISHTLTLSGSGRSTKEYLQSRTQKQRQVHQARPVELQSAPKLLRRNPIMDRGISECSYWLWTLQ